MTKKRCQLEIENIYYYVVIKGQLLCKIHFYLFEHKCVLAVCTQPPYNYKNPPATCLILINHKQHLRASRLQIP